MGTLIIDKRLLPKNNSVGSRQKFIDRYKGAIKQRVKEIITDNSIKDFNKGGPKKVVIKRDLMGEPEFTFDRSTGNKDHVLIGNKKFKKGDQIGKDRQGQGKGSGGPGNGNENGEDDFEFILTEKEFSDLFFEDLALPDLYKKDFLGSCWEIKHAGFSRYGGPSSLNIKKTMLNALGRRTAIKNRRKKDLENLLPKAKIQYIEDIDLRYNFKEKVDVPSTRAVMICLMDVSGSMGETEKDIAKRFYILLSLFLKRNYTVVDIIFVRHTETAEEVSEETFFYDRQNGGTLISSGYEKINQIIKARYNPDQWNIYVAQASDGDNWDQDNKLMQDVLTTSILPVCQYFAYIDLRYGIDSPRSVVCKLLEKLGQAHKNLQARVVRDYADIFPVFRSLFKKKE